MKETESALSPGKLHRGNKKIEVGGPVDQYAYVGLSAELQKNVCLRIYGHKMLPYHTQVKRESTFLSIEHDI